MLGCRPSAHTPPLLYFSAMILFGFFSGPSSITIFQWRVVYEAQKDFEESCWELAHRPRDSKHCYLRERAATENEISELTRTQPIFPKGSPPCTLWIFLSSDCYYVQRRTRMDRKPARQPNNSQGVRTEAVGNGQGNNGQTHCSMGSRVAHMSWGLGCSRSPSNDGFQNAHLLINSWGGSPHFSSNLKAQWGWRGVWLRPPASETRPASS